MAKKGRTKSWKKQKQEQVIEKPREPDVLSKGTRIGMVIMGYVLFILGSISALIIGYAGRHKRGASEVIIIGWILIIVHALFFSLLVINPAKVGIQPVKIIYEILLVYPVLCAILGLIGFKWWWGNTFRVAALFLAIPHYLILGMVANPSIVWDEISANEMVSKANMRVIQKHLEKYAEIHNGEYPQDIQNLVNDRLMSSMPVNPYLNPQPSMLAIGFGQEPYEGNFTYVPVNIEGRIAAYYLIGYGSSGKSGIDVNKDGFPDHVIMVLDGVGYSKDMSALDYQSLVDKVPTVDKLLGSVSKN